MKVPNGFKLIGYVLAFLLLAASSLAIKGNPHSVQTMQNESTGPQIIWSEPRMSINIGIGGHFIQPVSVQANADLTATVSVSPNIAGIVAVEPSGVLMLRKGVPTTINVTFRVPSDAAVGEQEGLLRLVIGREGNEKPLEIGVDIRRGFVDPSSNIGLVLPNIGIPAQIQLAGNATNPAFDIQTLRAGDGTFVTVANLHLYTNPDHLSLPDWFAKNVDQSGVLAANNTFQRVSAGGGKDAMFLTGDVPDDYDGLVQFGYVMSPTRDRVIAISQNQDNQLVDFGFSLEATRAFERQVIDNIEFFQ